MYICRPEERFGHWSSLAILFETAIYLITAVHCSYLSRSHPGIRLSPPPISLAEHRNCRCELLHLAVHGSGGTTNVYYCIRLYMVLENSLYV